MYKYMYIYKYIYITYYILHITYYILPIDCLLIAGRTYFQPEVEAKVSADARLIQTCS